MRGDDFAMFLIVLTLVMGGIILVLTAMWRRTKLLEMRHRERLALIERGLVPAPEADPAGFDRAWRQSAGPTQARMLSGGIVTVGLGLALMCIIGFAGGEGETAVGIGGAVVILGAAFIVNAVVGNRLGHGSRPAPPLAPPPPPANTTTPASRDA